MNTVEKGVANFQDFQKEARNFFSRADERAKIGAETDKRRARVHFALLGGLISLVVAVFIWLLTWVTSFEKRHPHVSANAAVQLAPKDAGLPPQYQPQ